MTQCFSATPNPANAGDTLSITYCNENKANQIVTIELSSAEGEPPTTHELQLDGDGCGTFDFPIPSGWGAVVLNGPQSNQLSVPVNL